MSIRNCRPPALLSVAGLACVLAGTASAQSGTGSVRGTVRDQTAAVISGARLDLTNTATNIVLRTTANEVGIYVFPSVNTLALTPGL